MSKWAVISDLVLIVHFSRLKAKKSRKMEGKKGIAQISYF